MPHELLLHEEAKHPSNQGQNGPFAALVAQASLDPIAAEALAQAYLSVPPMLRLQLVKAAIADAHAEDTSAEAVLLTFLSVEDDRDTAAHIAALFDGIRKTRAAEVEPPEGHIAGDLTDGALLLFRPLYSGFDEGLAIRWREDSGISDVRFLPLTRREQSPELWAFTRGDTATPLGGKVAVDVLAEVVWRHRRLGLRIPPDVERFLDFGHT